MEYRLYNVKGLWMRVHAPHNYSQSDGRSMPCAFDAPDAKYEGSFVISEEIAKQAARKCVEAYNGKKKHDWLEYKPSGLGDLFKRETDMNGIETGNYILKAVKKTYGENGNAPKVWMPNSKEATDDFRITNGSTCHVVLTLAPWNYAGKAGVQFRLKGVMVTELADAPSMDNPFVDDPNAEISANGSSDAELDNLLDDLAGKDKPAASAPFNDDIPF